MNQPYAVTAEFYDLLQAEDQLAVVDRLADRWFGTPRVGVLDVGAGTGLATFRFAQRCDLPLHAVEPSASMRSVLLSRLATRPDIRPRVRVHAAGIQELGLRAVADFGWCLNTMGGLDAGARRRALAALAEALVPGGVAVVQRPPATACDGRRGLPSVELGGDVYTGDVTSAPVGSAGVRWCFRYRVVRDGELVRQETETFDGHLVSEERFDAELRAAGLTPTGADSPDVVVVRRVGVGTLRPE
ncbi:class I SAM-dependent methyltransferase [Catellatospora tritici]|uniref:class I SAM-dependent methyltransferase n=1 Tax=Catellatospora tritici TaxID=2851566 RepID=UPI001C2DA7BE|nr:class I SAM-dependent methyltransferase [Catellatospora tritici]MBV1849316.1 class I SAM-dependent methyltransferase [Catellatospora tritici]